MKKERTLYLNGEVSSNNLAKFITTIIDINMEDDADEKKYKDFKREPIILFINSKGGEAYEALALIDVIETSKTPVYTCCIGSCMSAGLWIYLSGHKRYMGRNATLMFHSVAFGVTDKIEGIKQELNEATRLNEIYCNYIIKKTKVKRRNLNHYIESKSEWYIDYNKAKKLGFCHGTLR